MAIWPNPRGGLIPRELWSLDEYVVVADLYLRRGRSSGVHDPDVLRLAGLTGRTPASISRRLGNFEGTARAGRGLKPVTGEALTTFRAMQTDAALRAQMVSAATSRLLAGGRSADVQVAPPSPRLVPPEEFTAGAVEVRTEAQIRQMVRIEGELVRRYRAWLDPSDQRLRSWLIPAGADVLRTDLYDTRLNLLIEAKAAPTRDLLRQAIGQLIDYRRYLSPRPRLAILLPERPSADLAALPGAVDIGLIWAVADGFEDSVGGQFVHRTRV
jgi:hypothetical protein